EILALEAAYEGDAHTCDEMGILAEGLLEAAPPRVATDGEHRTETLVRARDAHLHADRVRELFDEIGLPGAREPDRLGKHGRVPGHQTGADLLVDDRGDA